MHPYWGIQVANGLRNKDGNIIISKVAPNLHQTGEVKKTQKPLWFLGFGMFVRETDYLLENWGARRAAFRPYFFLSFILGSRVMKPAAFREGRFSGFSTTRARETP